MDWINSFMEYTDGITSPRLFRLWSAISAVAGAMERRCFANTSRGSVYPNMFVLLVGPPGTGKTESLKHIEELWYSVGKFHVSPNNMTKAAMIDSLLEAHRNIILESGKKMLDYHSLLIPSSEFGVLVPAHDLEFLSLLNHLYDNPKVHREKRRHFNSGKDTEIINPQINIIAGTQPGFLAHLLPEEAWSMGFTSRIIMVYCAYAPVVPLFGDDDLREGLYKKLKTELIEISDLIGQFSWDEKAADLLSKWHQAGMAPVPEHPKLVHYNPRRILHIIKLSMVSSTSSRRDLIIKPEDVNRARDWLLEAEDLMPDIFKDMVHKSDENIILELHMALTKIYAKDKISIPAAKIYHLLQAKLPSERIAKVVEIAERSGVLARIAGNQVSYMPRAKEEWGKD